MRKKRHGPALFELLEDRGASIFKPLSNKLRQTSRVAPQPTIERSTPKSDQSSSEPPSTSPASAGPWISLDGDRIRIALRSVSLAATLFVFILSLLLAYGLGTRQGEHRGLQKALAVQNSPAEKSNPDDIATVRELRPSPDLIKDIAAGTQRPAPQTANPGREPISLSAQEKDNRPSTAPVRQERPAVSWVKDDTYIVAQEMPAAAMASAQAAQEFLARGGVQTTIVKPNDRTLLLMTTHGYNHKDAAEKRHSEQLLERIRALGTEFYAAGGGYKLEGYFRTLKRDSW